jgi:hypothetical protein
MMLCNVIVEYLYIYIIILICKLKGGCHGRDRMELDLQLSMQSVPIDHH